LLPTPVFYCHADVTRRDQHEMCEISQVGLEYTIQGTRRTSGGIMALRKLVLPLALAVGGLTVGGLAAAQDLTELLPEETFLALGMQDLAGASAQLGDFSAEFRRLNVAGTLSALGARQGATGGGMGSGGAGVTSMDDLPEEARRALETLSSLEVLGQEAWIALSASSVSPLPALTMVTRVTPEGAERVQALLDAVGTEGTEQLEESGTPFFQIPLEGTEPFGVVAYALTDDLLALSTNPDELRGVLRRLSGADEPNFADAQGYSDTLATLDSGTFYSFFNYARVAEVAAPYGQNLGFDPLIERLSQAFTTAGTVGSVVRLTDDAMISESFQAPDRDGGDASLYTLLTEDTAAATDVPVPEGALGFTVNAVNLSGWYDYLNELALTVPELGGDLDSLILSFTGLNLRESVFSWAGDQVVTVTTGLGEAVEPGVPSENLLGEAAYLIEATNAAAAQSGLGALLQNLSRTASSLADPQGGAGEPQSEEQTIAGVAVTRYDITPGVAVLYAVNGGYAVLATSEDAMTQTLTAQQEGGRDDLFGDVPGGATSFAYTNNRATFEGLSQQLSSQIQLAAGMGGASGLNFKAVEAASGVVEEFLGFVATRLSDSTTYSERADGGIHSYSETAVDWQE